MCVSQQASLARLGSQRAVVQGSAETGSDGAEAGYPAGGKICEVRTGQPAPAAAGKHQGPGSQLWAEYQVSGCPACDPQGPQRFNLWRPLQLALFQAIVPAACSGSTRSPRPGTPADSRTAWEEQARALAEFFKEEVVS